MLEDMCVRYCEKWRVEVLDEELEGANAAEDI
jgi:hypothetical protein